ncbi:MAG: ThuA domain-containing protein [Saprospiraceae bacterium]
MNKFKLTGMVYIGIFFLACSKDQNKDDHVVVMPNVLIYSQTKAYRHECIEPGSIALESYFKSHGVASVHSEDSSMISDEKLKPFDVVIFFQTTGNILDTIQQDAFQKFIKSGKGFVGIHSAADTEYDWPWYINLVGAQFADHAEIQSATLQRTDTSHMVNKYLPERWTRTDEWYNFKQAPANVQVLLSLDESTYHGGAMGTNHPMAWNHEYDGGRAFYTALGHTVESYRDTLFLEHVLQGVKWAASK